MVSRSPIAERAWHLIVIGAGITHLLVGFTFLVTDTNLRGPVFDTAGQFHDWAWGWWALLSGAGIVIAKTRFVALIVTAAWYALWGVVLIWGVVENDGPFYAVPIYIFLIVLHATFALIDWIERHQ